MKSFEFDASLRDGLPMAYLNDARAGITSPGVIEARRPAPVGVQLSGRAARRASGHRLPIDLESCRRKYSKGRRVARAAARELRRMTAGDVLDVDRAKVLVGLIRDQRTEPLRLDIGSDQALRHGDLS